MMEIFELLTEWLSVTVFEVIFETFMTGALVCLVLGIILKIVLGRKR